MLEEVINVGDVYERESVMYGKVKYVVVNVEDLDFIKGTQALVLEGVDRMGPRIHINAELLSAQGYSKVGAR